jgi:hypothetical protein
MDEMTAGTTGARGMEFVSNLKTAAWLDWRRVVIAAIKVVHSAIFLMNSAAIVHIFVSGVLNRSSRWTPPALIAALVEVAVFIVNHGRCPLTDLAEALGAEDGRVSDIFLPMWLADRIPQLCTPPLVVGLLAMLFHAWRRTRFGAREFRESATDCSI